MSNGKIIVMEGACDGVGKSTQSALLKQRLEENKIDVVKHHFPSYDLPQGKLVSNYLNGDYGTPKEISPYLVNSLYAIDRAITWNTYLKKLYEEGSYILLDRYTTSSLIYQTANMENNETKKDFIKYVLDYEYNKLGLKEPDQVLFLYGPYEVFEKLRHARKENEGIQNDIHEREDSFMKKVYNNAMFIAEYLNWDMIDCVKNNEMDTIENIHNKVYTLVNNKNELIIF